MTNTTSKIDFQNVVETIETAASTNNKRKKDLIIPVELVDKIKRFEDRDRDEEPITIQFQMKYKYNKN